MSYPAATPVAKQQPAVSVGRRRLLKAGCISGIATALGVDPSRSASEDSDQQCDALFVLSARGMVFENGVLTLSGPNPTVLYFCDRPVREAGHLTLEALSAHVTTGKNNFKEDPPNAAISIFNDDGSVEEAVVTLPSAPVIGNDTVSLEVTGIEGTLPAKAGAVSVFIDPIGMPLSPTSVAGVHRRHRRRAIRRHH